MYELYDPSNRYKVLIHTPNVQTNSEFMAYSLCNSTQETPRAQVHSSHKLIMHWQ